MASTALITGASSGIGLELAKIFAREGYDLVLVARRGDRLEALAGELRASGRSVHTIAKDLSLRESVSEIAAELDRSGIAIDVLVNNAGTATFGHFVDHDWAKDRETIDLNIAAPTELTHRLLPGMVKRGKGRILFVASTAGFQGLPYISVYAASKAYLLSLSDALADELRGTGVTVTALCPGPTDSEFAVRSGSEHSGIFARGTMTSAAVAEIGYQACMRGRRIVVAGVFNKMLVAGSKFIPRSWATFIGRLM
ncbi:MAG TPA: SDR family oxidoreductase, partial [Pirellulales bacterium]|nr:SDR family oxidoreductase [Pirellulales bacterium]